jgi:hypothetical protein
MSGSSRVKDPFGGGTYFGILVDEALDLRIGTWVIRGKMVLCPVFIIFRDRLLELLKL